MMKQSYELSPAELSEIKDLITSNGQIKMKVQEIEDKVYQTFEIHNQKEFENYVLQIQKVDPKIREINDYIKKCYMQSMEGEPFFIEIDFPPEFTPELVFEVKKNLTKNELEELVKFCIEYEHQHSRINPQDPNFGIGIERAFKLGQENFTYPEVFLFTDEHLPSTILSQALFKFSD